jgi:hypothetical protein
MVGSLYDEAGLLTAAAILEAATGLGGRRPAVG